MRQFGSKSSLSAITRSSQELLHYCWWSQVDVDGGECPSPSLPDRLVTETAGMMEPRLAGQEHVGNMSTFTEICSRVRGMRWLGQRASVVRYELIQVDWGRCRARVANYGARPFFYPMDPDV